ncbi:MAG: Crp/Fnr family transcriptional regulator [Kofleriaceae bacterium]
MSRLVTLMYIKHVDASDLATFRAAIRRFAPIDDPALAGIQPKLRVLAKGQWFLAAGDIAHEAGFVLEGVVREYFPLEDGREATRNFGGPGDGVGSLSDLLSGKPALASTIAETDCRLAVIPWATVQAAAARDPVWTRWLARVTEQLYLAKAQRELELLAFTAEQRYAAFHKRFAAIEDQIALRQVASYLGITPEHLSRIRRR